MQKTVRRVRDFAERLERRSRNAGARDDADQARGGQASLFDVQRTVASVRVHLHKKANAERIGIAWQKAAKSCASALERSIQFWMVRMRLACPELGNCGQKDCWREDSRLSGTSRGEAIRVEIEHVVSLSRRPQGTL